MINKRNALLTHEIESASEKIADKTAQMKVFSNAKTILFYYPIKNEINLISLLKKNISEKTICLPRIEKEAGIMSARIITSLDNIKKDKFGILAPSYDDVEINPYEIDFIIVPLVAFDKSLNRIGYGGGYYDRYLKKCNNAYKCGVAYSFQETNDIISEGYDIKMDSVVTDI